MNWKLMSVIIVAAVFCLVEFVPNGIQSIIFIGMITIITCVKDVKENSVLTKRGIYFYVLQDIWMGLIAICGVSLKKCVVSSFQSAVAVLLILLQVLNFWIRWAVIKKKVLPEKQAKLCKDNFWWTVILILFMSVHIWY